VKAETLRATVFADLEALGFRPATWLPLPDLTRTVRPAAEIAARLMALDALFTWAAFPEEAAPTARVEKYIGRNRLRDWLTEEENAILSLGRAEAHETHGDNIGWKLENMWPLAWVLGFEPEPAIEASQVPDEIVQGIIEEFLVSLDGTVPKLVAKVTPRGAEEVIALEDRFYCAHNAVRNAQMGRHAVPKGFHPVIHGGAVHERRHSLTWCLSPGVAWEDTDLNT
jgi:hypothetical protein